ncbi:MAG: hypothetical protein ABSC21_19045 [Terriglobia bacterium]
MGEDKLRRTPPPDAGGGALLNDYFPPGIRSGPDFKDQPHWI